MTKWRSTNTGDIIRSSPQSGSNDQQPSQSPNRRPQNRSVSGFRKIIYTIVIIAIAYLLITKYIHIPTKESHQQEYTEWGYIKYTHGNVNIREERSLFSQRIGTVSAGTAIRVEFYQDNFYALFDVNETNRDIGMRLGYIYAPLLYDSPR